MGIETPSRRCCYKFEGRRSNVGVNAEINWSRDFAFGNLSDGVLLSFLTPHYHPSFLGKQRRRQYRSINMADKEATVYIVDMGISMGEKRNQRTQSDLDWAMTYVWEKITSTVGIWMRILLKSELTDIGSHR